MNKNISYMKTIFRMFAATAVLVAAAACQQFKIDTQMTPEKAAASIRLECDALTSYTVASTDAGAVTFNVSSNTPWTITRSSGADWCTVSPSSSAQSSLISDVVVSFEDNTSAEDRAVTLTVKGENVNKVYTVTITQARFGSLFVTPVASDYAAAGGPLNFTILTNVDWSVRSDASWLHFNRESGSPDPEGRTITIVATADPSEVLERTATVTVVAGDDQETFEVTQKAVFSVSAFEDAFLAAGSSQGLVVRTDLPWTVTADKTWISFDKESGTGTGASETITATAAANEGAARTANITVTAGGTTHTFEVSQLGLAFEIVAPASTELPRQGGEMVIEVNSSLTWEPETDQADWTVEKTDDTHFKVKVPFNNKFVAKSGKVAIVAGTNRAELELTQDINFTFSGNTEILEDGSVKITGGAVTHVTTKDSYRYMKMVLTMGECHFATKGELWVSAAQQAGACNIYNQLTVGGNTRTRTDGAIYKSTSFSITLEELNAMTSYGVILEPGSDPANMHFEFQYNGVKRGEQEGGSPFYGNTDTTPYWFGSWNDATADTWYIVKSCDITVIEE